jgi:hypothetical protein
MFLLIFFNLDYIDSIQNYVSELFQFTSFCGFRTVINCSSVQYRFVVVS